MGSVGVVLSGLKLSPLGQGSMFANVLSVLQQLAVGDVSVSTEGAVRVGAMGAVGT